MKISKTVLTQVCQKNINMVQPIQGNEGATSLKNTRVCGEKMCGTVEEVLRKSQLCQLTASIRKRLGCRLGLTGADQADTAHQQLLCHSLFALCSTARPGSLLSEYETMLV